MNWLLLRFQQSPKDAYVLGLRGLFGQVALALEAAFVGNLWTLHGPLALWYMLYICDVIIASVAVILFVVFTCRKNA